MEVKWKNTIYLLCLWMQNRETPAPPPGGEFCCLLGTDACCASAVEKWIGTAGTPSCCTLIPSTVGSVVHVHLGCFACSTEAPGSFYSTVERATLIVKLVFVCFQASQGGETWELFPTALIKKAGKKHTIIKQ